MASALRVRNSAKAIIFDPATASILLIEHVGKDGAYFTFPGGGQEHGETLTEAVQRECIEEVGARVHCGDLVVVRDYIGRNHEFAHDHPDYHGVEFYFLCSLEDTSLVTMGQHPDVTQVGIQWIQLSELSEMAIYPKVLRPLLKRIIEGESHPVYLGDVN
jgi:8-oxo-dGTP diphosphatase